MRVNLEYLGFTIWVVCIVLGTVFTLASIWWERVDNDDPVFSLWLTIWLLYLAIALTRNVSKGLARD